MRGLTLFLVLFMCAIVKEAHAESPYLAWCTKDRYAPKDIAVLAAGEIPSGHGFAASIKGWEFGQVFATEDFAGVVLKRVHNGLRFSGNNFSLVVRVNLQ